MHKPPRTRPGYSPAPLPSRFLVGMEKAIPPQTRSSSSSPFSPLADVNKPLPNSGRSSSRSPFSLAADRDKPLPERPRRSSSIYTSDSESIASDLNRSDDEDPSLPRIIQPTPYKGSIAGRRRRVNEPPSPKPFPSAISITPLASQTSRNPRHISRGTPAKYDISAPAAAESRNAPGFSEFARNLASQNPMVVDGAAHLSPYPRTPPDFRAGSYESTSKSLSISPRTSDIADQTLVPAPLSISRNRDVMGSRSKSNDMSLRQEDKSKSRFSDGSSDDSYVIYTGIRDSVRAYFRDKMQKKGTKSQEERQRVMSVASAKYPGMLTAKEYDRRFSSDSRKPSLQQGMSSVYNQVRRLSISASSGQSREEKQRPRGRKKQAAIPMSPYQRHGAAVWIAPKRQKKTRPVSEARRRTEMEMENNYGRDSDNGSISGKPVDVVDAFWSGRSRIIHALDETKHKLRRSHSEKRREVLKESIRLVGPASHVSDGRTSYPV